MWHSGSSASQLLFIFPTRVSFTTITLHYYNDSVRGLSRLRFYAVPDDFEVWDAPAASHSHVDIAPVPPSVEPAGRRNVSVSVNFSTTKVLMYKFRSTLAFALSEVEFFTCGEFQSALCQRFKFCCAYSYVALSSIFIPILQPSLQLFPTLLPQP